MKLTDAGLETVLVFDEGIDLPHFAAFPLVDSEDGRYCAHPTHFADALPEGDSRTRIGGLRANASRLSHAELDEAAELDSGDPADLAERYVALRSDLSNLEVVGGCCGTDIRHVTAICDAWLAAG